MPLVIRHPLPADRELAGITRDLLNDMLEQDHDALAITCRVNSFRNRVHTKARFIYGDAPATWTTDELVTLRDLLYDYGTLIEQNNRLDKLSRIAYAIRGYEQHLPYGLRSKRAWWFTLPYQDASDLHDMSVIITRNQRTLLLGLLCDVTRHPTFFDDHQLTPRERRLVRQFFETLPAARRWEDETIQLDLSTDTQTAVHRVLSIITSVGQMKGDVLFDITDDIFDIQLAFA